MIGLPGSVRILLFSEPTDMRKGFDGLGAMVTAAGESLYSGHLFVFLSRRRDRAKILTFQKGGFVLWYKRLERGRFKPVRGPRSRQVELDATRVKKPRHWQPPRSGIDIAART